MTEDMGRVQLNPDVLLPSQHLPRTLATPEKRLLLAVLEEAVNTFRRYVVAKDHRDHAVFEDVETWFASDDGKWLYSFVGICDSLGIEVGYVRSGLRRWRRRYGMPMPETAQPVSPLLLRRMNGVRTRVTGHAVGMPRRV